MNDINLFTKELVDALGWTFVHSLWQGFLLFIVLTTLIVVFRRFSSSTKYLLGVSFLFLFLATSIVTFFIVYEPTHTMVGLNPVNQSVLDQPGYTEDSLTELRETSADKTAVVTISMPYYANFNKFFPVIVGFWLLGILIFSIKYLGSWIYIRRLRNRMVRGIDAYWERKCDKLGEKLRLSKKYIVRFSSIVTTPMVIGFFKPVILLPTKIITQLPEKQIEAILAHELAHIKRNDYLVNIIQIAMEVVFFYHPAVWLISSRIRTERENCCDDLTVSITGKTVDYAEALVNISRVEIQNKFGLAFSGNQHNLKDRVQRMFTDRTLIADFKERLVTVVVIFAGLFSLGWGMILQSEGKRDVIKKDLSGQVDKNALEPVSNKNEDNGIFFPAIAENDPKKGFLNNKSSNQKNSRLTSKEVAKTTGSQLSELQIEEALEIKNLQDDIDSKAIFEAIKKGNIKEVKALIKAGADLEQINENGETPLLLAVKENNYEIAKLLINKGADISFVRKDGRSILFEAADEKDFRITELLLKKGVAIDYHTNKNPAALFEAIDKGNIKVVKILVEEGVDIEATDKKGRTALMYSIDEGEIEIAHLLIQAGANVNAGNDDGWTILMEAALRDSPDLVATLLSQGADVGALTYHSHTALNGAVRRERMENVRLLIQAGADVNWKYDGLTPLHEAVRRNNFEIAKLLLDNNANIEIGDNSKGETVLFAAGDEKDQRLLELLIQKGGRVDAARYDGRTALYEAIQAGNITNAKILIEKGADVNWNKYNDLTPLMYAIERKKMNMVVLLIENGADIRAKRRNGWNIKQIAERSKHDEIISYIQSRLNK